MLCIRLVLGLGAYMQNRLTNSQRYFVVGLIGFVGRVSRVRVAKQSACVALYYRGT